MQALRQSTAVDVLIGPFVDLANGYGAETGESPAVKLSKNGQTLAAKNDATTPAHDADGYYNCELDATDTDTVGTLTLTVAASANAREVVKEYQVLEEAAYDAMYAADTTGPATDAPSSVLTTQMTESYAANGTAPTLAQAIFAIHQMLQGFAISSTTISVKKLDGSTEAFTVTLDDASNPTQAIRS